MPSPLKPPGLDTYTADYLKQTVKSLDRIPVNIFLCGSALDSRAERPTRERPRDIRRFLKKRLENGVKRCDVKLGEHKALIRAFSQAVGARATNLADHELGLAKGKKMDLVIIFPCSPGSFAELGMFCLVEGIAAKMRIFIHETYKRKKSYIMQGPVKAAEQNNAKIFFVDYAEREKIWSSVHEVVLEVKAKKRKRRLLSG